MVLGFLVGQNVLYGSGCAGLAYLDHCSTGMAKAIEHSFAYPSRKLNVTMVPLDASPQTHEGDGTSRTKDA